MQCSSRTEQELLLPELLARTPRLDDELISWTESDVAVFEPQMPKDALVRMIAAHFV